jgi:hypothetical protein
MKHGTYKIANNHFKKSEYTGAGVAILEKGKTFPLLNYVIKHYDMKSYGGAEV